MTIQHFGIFCCNPVPRIFGIRLCESHLKLLTTYRAVEGLSHSGEVDPNHRRLISEAQGVGVKMRNGMEPESRASQCCRALKYKCKLIFIDRACLDVDKNVVVRAFESAVVLCSQPCAGVAEVCLTLK